MVVVVEVKGGVVGVSMEANKINGVVEIKHLSLGLVVVSQN
jgi:hypothetical protein